MYISIITYYWVFDMTCILHKDFGLLKKSPRKCGEWWIDLYSCVLFLFRVVLLLCRIYDVYCFVKKNRCSLLENIYFDTKEVLPFFCGKVDLMGVEPISEHRPLIFVITIITISICFFLVKISDRFLFSDIERFLWESVHQHDVTLFEPQIA